MNDQTKPVMRVRRPNLSSPKPTDDATEGAPTEAEQRAQGAYTDEMSEEFTAAQAAIAEEVETAKRAREARAEVPPMGAVREEVRREGHASPIPPGFVPRDGDVLVVTYPEVTLPLPKAYSMMKFGGLIYTRTLRDGDDVQAEATTISAWITRVAEAEGVAKYRRLVAEFIGKGKG